MARETDISRIQNPPSGDGHHVTSRYMTATELAERDARQKTYDDMLARQQAYEDRFIRQPQQPDDPGGVGCVFAKSCNLPNGVINHNNPSGIIPVEKLTDFGQFTLLGGRERNAAGSIPLKKISGSTLPAGLGTLVLGRAGAAGAAINAAGGVGIASGVLLLVHCWEWLPCYGHPVWGTVPCTQKNSSSRSKKAVHVSDCISSNRPMAP